MIKAEQKPIPEIREMVSQYHKVLILGCETCVTICFAGGESEVAALASRLRIAERREGTNKEFVEATVKRQCEDEFIAEQRSLIEGVDAVLSLACAIGVQAVAERFPRTPVLPGVNTSFLGLIEKPGEWSEVCLACGDCILHLTAGLCPIARCAKSLLNGPCGGSVGGRCEISQQVPCVWQQIYDRLALRGQLHLLRKLLPLRDWVSSEASRPRRRLREDISLPP